MVKLTEGQLRKLASWWMGELKLGDWTVKLQMVSQADIDGSVANCTTNLSLGMATVRISRYESRAVKDQQDCDMEVDLVHELLHLQFDVIDRFCSKSGITPLQSDIALERPINAVARALVHLRRKGGR